MYLKQIRIKRREFPTPDLFPFNIPAVQKTDQIDISSRVTFFVGENGSGKSALLDTIARKSGFLPGVEAKFIEFMITHTRPGSPTTLSLHLRPGIATGSI